MQTWSNLLSYIHRNLGSKLNLLEMSDDEIMEGIKSDIIPLFSQHSPHKKYCILTNGQLCDFAIGDTQWKYQLPITVNEYVIDIYDIYINTGSDGDPFYDTKYGSGNVSNIRAFDRGSTNVFGGGMIDIVIDNEFLTAMQSLSKKNTWEFESPKTIRFDSEISTAVVIYCTSHENLDTISPDFYNIIFKPLSLGYVLKWIVALRSKYETLSTPMGEVRMNWNKLEQDSEKLITEANEKLENILPDHFLEIV